jgi:hypothetical protein
VLSLDVVVATTACRCCSFLSQLAAGKPAAQDDKGDGRAFLCKAC